MPPENEQPVKIPPGQMPLRTNEETIAKYAVDVVLFRLGSTNPKKYIQHLDVFAPLGQFSKGAFVCGAYSQGVNCRGLLYRGLIVWGFYPGGFCPAAFCRGAFDLKPIYEYKVHTLVLYAYNLLLLFIYY